MIEKMSELQEDTIQLKNGVKVPILGLGKTFQSKQLWFIILLCFPCDRKVIHTRQIQSRSELWSSLILKWSVVLM